MNAVDALPPNPHGYPPVVWRLFNQTPLSGDFDARDADVVVAEMRTPAARSVLRLALRHAQGRVIDARFRAYGCPTTIAVGAWIAQWSLGRPLAELAALDAADLREALEISDDRAHCSLLGEDALKAVLARVEGEP